MGDPSLYMEKACSCNKLIDFSLWLELPFLLKTDVCVLLVVYCTQLPV